MKVEVPPQGSTNTTYLLLPEIGSQLTNQVKKTQEKLMKYNKPTDQVSQGEALRFGSQKTVASRVLSDRIDEISESTQSFKLQLNQESESGASAAINQGTVAQRLSKTIANNESTLKAEGLHKQAEIPPIGNRNIVAPSQQNSTNLRTFIEGLPNDPKFRQQLHCFLLSYYIMNEE